jgi:nucleoside-diphosphate-sugar epimerase
MYLTNVVGTRQLLEALSQLPQVPKSVVLASSANVYGNGREGVLDETVPPTPANDYGVSKLAAEQVALLYSCKLPLIVVRPFNYTGRGQSADFLVPKIIAHAKHRAPLIELGNTDVARDFSDVRCVAEIYARLLDASRAIGGTFNICSGHPVSLQQVIDLVCQLSGHRLQVRVNPALVRAEEVRKLWGSAAKLTSLIGPLPTKPLEETLRWMLEA